MSISFFLLLCMLVKLSIELKSRKNHEIVNIKLVIFKSDKGCKSVIQTEKY